MARQSNAFRATVIWLATFLAWQAPVYAHPNGPFWVGVGLGIIVLLSLAAFGLRAACLRYIRVENWRRHLIYFGIVVWIFVLGAILFVDDEVLIPSWILVASVLVFAMLFYKRATVQQRIALRITVLLGGGAAFPIMLIAVRLAF